MSQQYRLARSAITLVFFRSFILALLLLLSACTSTPLQQDIDPSLYTTWTQQRQLNQHLNSWLARGKIIIENQQESQGARLFWKQQQAAYQIQLSAAAGFGKLILTGDKSSITVKTPRTETTFSDIQHALRFYQLPPLALEHIPYWLVGVDSPLAAIESSEQRHGLLITLQQQQWLIDYDRYHQVKQYILPQRIRLKHQAFTITIDIYEWQIK